jgi:hypothetical protein
MSYIVQKDMLFQIITYTKVVQAYKLARICLKIVSS